MSSSAPSTIVHGGAQPPPSPPPPPSAANYLNSFGLGYAIAVALGFLVLLSTLLLASYVCCRASSRRRRHQNPNSAAAAAGDDGIIVPRIIFVAEEDNEDDELTVVGLDSAVINSYPKFEFRKNRGGVNDSMCSICLCEYKDGEMLRMLPECRHYFHVSCVDAWLKLNASCPVCRNSPLPTPISTPLQEVVPLSQYTDGRRRS